MARVCASLLRDCNANFAESFGRLSRTLPAFAEIVAGPFFGFFGY